jgi:hypothetical protein
MTTSDREDSAPVTREGLNKLGFAVMVAAGGTLISSLITSLTKLQPVAVFAAATGVALLAVTSQWLQQSTMAERTLRTATIGLTFAYSLLWLAAYLLVRSL